MTDKIEFNYGPHHHQRAQRWIPAGADKPWIVYVPGGGWSKTNPAAFFDKSLGEALWTDFIMPSELDFPVACFAMWYGSHRYDFSLVGDVPNDPSHAVFGEYPTTPRYLDSSTRDAQRLVQHVKDAATIYGVDPDKCILMGASAGGQVAGVAAYDYSAPYRDQHTSSLSRQHVSSSSSRVRALSLSITPDDWRNYSNLGLQRNLFGITNQEEWDAIPAHRKAALSPYGVLESTKRPVPTFLWYDKPFTGAQDQLPPYPGTDLHGPGNGNQIHELIQSLGGESRFHHPGNMDPTEYSGELWNWMLEQWGVEP